MRERLLTAITAFTESLSKWPENPEALYARGRARALRFDVEDADKDFARAVELRPAFPAAQTDRAKLLLQQYIEAKMHAGWRWSEEVERPYKRWKDLAKSVSADAAWVAFAEDRMNDALRLCEERLKEKPEQEELWKMAGDTLFLSMGSVEGGNPDPRQGVMIQRAIQAYTEAIRLRPNYYEARMMRGYVLSQGGEFKQGAVDIGVALRLRPDDALACWLMGRAVNDPSKALEWYDRGLKTHPDSFICRMNRAASLGQTGRYPEALAEIDRSVRLNPSHYYPVYLRASIRSMQGDMESCFQDSKKVVEMAPDFQSGWFNLGASAFNTKRWREAIAAMERALQLGMADRTAAEDTIRKAKRQLGE
jgi:tetratricopeptide (TPR) repeat protein